MSVIRNHLHFWLLAPALIVVMTWPAFYYVLDTETFWIPSVGHDVWYELWEGWYGGLILDGRADLFYTDLLFYPDGVSLIYHQHTVPHMLLYQMLRLLLPISSAYSLAFLLTLLANALATYICANLFVKDKWISLFAGAFVGICITLRAKTDAQFWTYYTLPLAVYFLHRAIAERSRLFAIVSGLAVGLTVYIGFYVLVCLIITVGIYGLYLACSRWRDPGFWWLALIAVFACAAVSLPRLAPMLSDREQVETVLEFRSYWDEASNDLLDFVAHPVFTNVCCRQQAYLGYVNILLACLSLALVQGRRKLLIWFLIMFVFIVLRLGTFLTINGTEYRDILLPKHYLNYLFPELFRGFAGGHHWVLGALLPLAILVCYSLQALFRSTTSWRKPVMIIGLIILVSIEHYHHPIASQIVTADSIAYVDWLKTKEEDQAIHLINVPMNTTFLRRYYNFIQMLTGYPQVEGSVNRLLPDAYAYINSNPILRRWREGEPIHCLPANMETFQAALDRLLNDGFTHVVFHHGGKRRPESHSFVSVPSAYKDDYVAIYRVAALQQSCDNGAMLGQIIAPQLRDLALSTEVSPDPDILLLSTHPTQSVDDGQFAYFNSVFDEWKTFAHVYGVDGEVLVQSLNGNFIDLQSVLASSQIILRILDPTQAESAALKSLDEKLDSHYRPCGRAIDTSQTIAEYFIRSEFPCAIMQSTDRYSVQYANGARLENALLDRRDSAIDLYLYWKNRPADEDIYAYSVQIFNAAGQKVQQADAVIGHDPLAHQRLDISAFGAGVYTLNLIVYDFNTGASVAGTASDSGSAFDRQLELTRFTIE